MKKLVITGLLTALNVASLSAQHWSLTWKKMGSVSPGLEQIGVLATRDSRQLGNSPWSVGCETLDRSYAEFTNYKEYVGELGVHSARIQSGWARTERTEGKYDFEWLDEVVDGLVAQGVAPWVCLSYGNPLYGADKGLGSKIFTDQPTLKAWERYVARVVDRYKDRVHEWEVWNEPNLGDNARYPEAYADLLIRTAEVVRRRQPDAVVIGLALSRMPISYTDKVLATLRDQKKLGLLNYVSFHPYVENPDDATSGIEALAQLVASYSPDIRLFQGESGCPSTLEWGHALRYYEWNEYAQAKWIMRRMINDWTLGIRSSIFTLVDLQYPNMQQSFGLIRTDLLKKPVYKRPSYHGVQHVVNLLPTSVTSCGKLTAHSNSAREITVSGIESGGKRIGALVWFSDRVPDDGLAWTPVELRIDSLQLKDPVYVELITGRVYALPRYHGAVQGSATKFTGLPLWDSPIAIIERSAVGLQAPAREQQAGGSTADMLY